MAGPIYSVMVFTETDNRRETWTAGGWNLADDDVTRRPEPDPLASAQSRRAWRESAPAGTAQPKLN